MHSFVFSTIDYHIVELIDITITVTNSIVYHIEMSIAIIQFAHL